MLKFSLSSFLLCIGILKIFCQTGSTLQWNALRQEFNKDSTEMIISDRDGPLHGKHKILLQHGSYGQYDISNGKIEGKAILYNSLGKLESIFFYKNGLRDGLNENYNAQDQVWLKGAYAKGKKHGIERTWSGDTLQRSTTYQNGLKHGVTNHYYQGVLIIVSNFLYGKKNGIERIYNLEGNLVSETNFKNDKKSGLYKTFIPESGQLLTVTTFKDNVREGTLTTYVNGKQKLVQHYSKGLKHGLSQMFDEDQHIVVTDYFWKDEKISKDTYNKLLELKEYD